MTSTGTRQATGRRVETIIVGTLSVVVLVAVIIVVWSRTGTPSAAAQPAPAPVAHRQAPAPVVPLTVTSISPANGSANVATNAPITVNFAHPVSATSPTPALNPAVPGTWTRTGSTMTFDPAAGWQPYGTETVTVPAATPASSTFHVQAGSRVRLEQLLAQLGYLPFTFEPSTPVPGAATTSDVISTSPLDGTLVWSWATVPGTLRALWQPGKPNVMDTGATMAFEADHGMTMDGIAGPRVWQTLLTAATRHQMAAHPYDYLVASETLPESLKVYRDGQVIYSTAANTGVPGATTQQGTFPVYLRYQSTTMRGTNPDGSTYDDPGVPWVAYFNGGDAVHGFQRNAYGFPQSNGCVELPVSNAASVWTMDPYGTLVTVTA